MYLVDKWALLRMTKRPPLYDNSIALFAQQLMPYAAVIHLLIAVWTYSEGSVLYSPNLFESGNDDVALLLGSNARGSLHGLYNTLHSFDTSGQDIVRRLALENTLPLFSLLVAFVFVWAFYVTAGVATVRVARAFFAWVSGGRCCMDKLGRDLQFNPPFVGECRNCTACGLHSMYFCRHAASQGPMRCRSMPAPPSTNCLLLRSQLDGRLSATRRMGSI